MTDQSHRQQAAAYTTTPSERGDPRAAGGPLASIDHPSCRQLTTRTLSWVLTRASQRDSRNCSRARRPATATPADMTQQSNTHPSRRP